jgi:curved DNA-binding protein CbpA
MSTLYDLLGALPDDNSESLRTAFRKAVKGAHPDINPGDPNAALKFREIIRANEILSDEDQRCAYDHLLDLARLEQESASKHALAARIHKFASGTMAVAGILVVTIGGCLLFMHISAASIALPHRLSERAAAGSADSRVANGQDASPAKPEKASVPAEADAPIVVTTVVIVPPVRGSAPAADNGSPASVVASSSTSPDNSDIPADRDSDPDGAISSPVQSIRFDAPSSGAFDPNIIFYHPQNIDQGFADEFKVKPAQRASCAAAVLPTPRKQRIEARATPVSPRRTAERDPSREAGLFFAVRR